MEGNRNRLGQLRREAIYKFRETNKESLINNNCSSDRAILKFIGAREKTPELICCCCEGLFFHYSVVTFDRTKLEKKLNDTLLQYVLCSISYPNGQYICSTCNNHMLKGKRPPLSTAFGLQFPSIPKCLQNLSDLEERMVSPFINFMQIRHLKKFALNPQLGMKGSVVNIPV